MSIILYDLVDKDGRRFSPYGWRIRMALLHKYLDFDVVLCAHSDKKLEFTGQHLVPVLVDGERIISDSWNIAVYLDKRYPDRPLLLNALETRSFARFMNGWTDAIVGRPLVRSLYLDIWRSLHPDADADAFRAKREHKNGDTLEALQARRSQEFQIFNRELAPLNGLLSEQPYIAGDQPAYADYIVFGTLQMPRNLGIEPLSDDMVALKAWRDKLEARHDALAKRSKL
jgi:glutathione S-transferase